MGLFKINAKMDFKISFKKGNIKNMNQENQNIVTVNAACAPRLNLDKISMLLYRSARKILEEKSGRMIFNMMENFLEENIQRCLDETQEIANEERKVLEQENCYNFGNAVDDDNFDKTENKKSQKLDQNQETPVEPEFSKNLPIEQTETGDSSDSAVEEIAGNLVENSYQPESENSPVVENLDQ